MGIFLNGTPTPLGSVKWNLWISSCYRESRNVCRLLWGGSVNCTWGMEKCGRMDLEGSRSWRSLVNGTGKWWCPMTDFYDDDNYDNYNDDNNNNNNSSSLCTKLARAFKTIAWFDKVTWNVFGRNWSWRNGVTLPSLVWELLMKTTQKLIQLARVSLKFEPDA